jgi:hypothetical protein
MRARSRDGTGKHEDGERDEGDDGEVAPHLEETWTVRPCPKHLRMSFHTFVTVAFHTCRTLPGTVAPMTKTATPWGPATLVEKVEIKQQVGDKRFASGLELLETERGERLLRFAYSTDGVARRGPVTMKARDVKRLRAALEKRPALSEALGGLFDAGAT